MCKKKEPLLVENKKKVNFEKFVGKSGGLWGKISIFATHT